MSKSARISPRGRNHISSNYISPVDSADNGINFLNINTGSTVGARFDSTENKFLLDELKELTSAAGITVDGLLIKDGTVEIGNNINLKIKNSSGTAQDILKLDGSNALTLSALWDTAAVRTALGLAIGSDVQAYDAQLTDIAALAVTDGNVIVGNGSTWVAESGSTARTSLGAAASGSNTDINSVIPTGALGLGSASTERWSLTIDGHVIPTAVSSYDVGSSSYPARAVYSDKIASSAANMTLDAITGAHYFQHASATTAVLSSSALYGHTNGALALGTTAKRFSKCCLTSANNAAFSYTTYSGAYDVKSVNPAAPGLTAEELARYCMGCLNNLIRALRETEIIRS